jgi:hypothetical protein
MIRWSIRRGLHHFHRVFLELSSFPLMGEGYGALPLKGVRHSWMGVIVPDTQRQPESSPLSNFG